jgi:hypothetical protein
VPTCPPTRRRNWCRWRAARLLTPVLGLVGSLNLIALGVVSATRRGVAENL